MSAWTACSASTFDRADWPRKAAATRPKARQPNGARARPAYCRPLDKAGLAKALAEADRTVAEGSWRT